MRSDANGVRCHRSCCSPWRYCHCSQPEVPRAEEQTEEIWDASVNGKQKERKVLLDGLTGVRVEESYKTKVRKLYLRIDAKSNCHLAYHKKKS